jgi:hypothetical protein
MFISSISILLPKSLHQLYIFYLIKKHCNIFYLQFFFDGKHSQDNFTCSLFNTNSKRFSISLSTFCKYYFSIFFYSIFSTSLSLSLSHTHTILNTQTATAFATLSSLSTIATHHLSLSPKPKNPFSWRFSNVAVHQGFKKFFSFLPKPSRFSPLHPSPLSLQTNKSLLLLHPRPRGST